MSVIFEGIKVERVTIKSRLVEYSLKKEFGSQRYSTQRSGSQTDLIDLLNSHDVKFETITDSTDTAGLITLLLSSGLLVGALAWLAKFRHRWVAELAWGMGVG